MYYLRSRYYTTQNNRFLNADGYLYEENLYSYCKNCPVSQVDPEGEFTASAFGDMSNDPINTMMADEMALGGGTWGALMRTLQSATKGLNMAMGQHSPFSTVPYTESKVYDPKKTKTGWKAGENIFNLTSKGRDPSWSTIRSRFWKNEYYYHKENYSILNQNLIKNGLAPWDRYGNPYHLHHPYGRDGDNYFVFGPVDPQTHLNIHSK